jgi:hypothetical protein
MQPGLITHPRETDTPPASLDQRGRRDIPPTFVYVQRREPTEGPAFTMAPWDQYSAFYDLNIPWQQAPDPIRQSDFWAANNKIHPAAQMMIDTHLAIGSREAVSEQTFRIGKLLGYLKRPMYAGMQQPSVIRANIQEAVPTTYGSMYEIQGIQPAAAVVTAQGFSVPIQDTSSTIDGYPY